MLGVRKFEQMIQSGDYIQHNNQQHYDCVVYYIVEGKKGLYIEEELIVLEKGSLLFINSHIRHRAVPVSRENYECLYFMFQPEILTPWKKMVPDFDFSLLFHRSYLYVRADSMDQVFLQGMNKTLITSYTNNMESVFNVKFLEYMMYLTMKTSLDKKGKVRKYNAKLQSFRSITDYIEEQNYCVSLEELSHKFYLSPYYICHLFKEVGGMTLLEYLNTHKIRKAQGMLKYTEETITEIAMECGYDTSSKFNRTFKKYVGISPSEFRKENKKIRK